MGKDVDKEFEGNVRIVASENKVQIWVCKEGRSIFRFKFIGQVHGTNNEFVVIGKEGQ